MVGVPEGAEPAMTRTRSRGHIPGMANCCTGTERMRAESRYYERRFADQFGTTDYYEIWYWAFPRKTTMEKETRT
jgi:hypothetical protein